LSAANKKPELQEEYRKIFIEQAPTAIAMLDNNMCYIAVSQSWIRDYGLEGKEIIGLSHYDVFPEISDDWKAIHQKCLKGATDSCEEAPFRRADGSIQWIHWDVSPWHNTEGVIGGLIMHTGDITHHKKKEREKERIEEILEETNKIARIGTWELDLATNEVYWNTITSEIYEVPEGYKPNFEEALNFFKNDQSRKKAKNAVKDAISHRSYFDIELELTTAKGNTRWIRVVGKSEFVNNKPSHLFGIIQDLSKLKLSEQALNRAHAELKAIFNSEFISIISTNADGIINNFNRGAESLLGYSASEIVGLKKPSIYLIEEDTLRFRNDLAKRYGKDPSTFNHYVDLPEKDFSDTREWIYRRKDGSTFPALSTLSAIRNNNGRIAGFVAVATDISEIKKAQTELLKKNQLLNFAEQITAMGHWQWDTVADKVKWSQNLYKLVELEEETVDLKFDTYFGFVHPEDKEIVSQHFEKSANDKRFDSFMHRIITTGGTTKTIQLLGKVITDRAGNVIEMIGTAQDVTEIKKAEKKFRGLLESAPDAMVIANEKGKIEHINRQTEELFGYTTEELYKKSVEVLIPNRVFSFPKTRITTEGEELYGVHKDGRQIPVQISFNPLYPEDGPIVVAAIKDVTTQKLAEQKLIEAKESLEVIAQKLSNQNRQLADFTHITSHNLRAPVSNLISLLEIYNYTENEEERKDLFGKFETVIQHLTLTLDTLVDALKTKINDSDEDLEYIALDNILNNTKEILSGKILKSGAVIRSDFSKVPNIRYNKIYMESIFLNLVGNSIKYKSEARSPEISITSEIKDGEIILKFEDNGLGIDMEKHGHKLFGLNKVFHRHPEAKGVGLFLTKTQIEAMGGVISASSEVNVGTTFTINFN
tara:strand:- start:21190 stop:23823 length:2634 start_codon:yes stop_codon:yes gene_type:complete